MNCLNSDFSFFPLFYLRKIDKKTPCLLKLYGEGLKKTFQVVCSGAYLLLRPSFFREGAMPEDASVANVSRLGGRSFIGMETHLRQQGKDK